MANTLTVRAGLPVILTSAPTATWTLKELPKGSSASVRVITTEKAVLFTDRPGRYVVETEGGELQVEADLLLNVLASKRIDASWPAAYIRNWPEAVEGGKAFTQAIHEVISSLSTDLLLDLYRRALSQSLATLPKYGILVDVVVEKHKEFTTPSALFSRLRLSGTGVAGGDREIWLDRALPDQYEMLVLDSVGYEISAQEGRRIVLREPHTMVPGATFAWAAGGLVGKTEERLWPGDNVRVLFEGPGGRKEDRYAVLGQTASGWFALDTTIAVAKNERASAAGVERGNRVPAPNGALSVPRIGELREGVDYWLEGGWIVFDKAVPTSAVADVVFLDNKVLTKTHFAAALLESGEELPSFRRGLIGLLYGLQHAGTVEGLEIALGALTGIPYSISPGIVLGFYPNAFPGEHLLHVEEDGREEAFRYPAYLGEPLYRTGETFPPWTLLAPGIEIEDFGEDSRWWERLRGVRFLARSDDKLGPAHAVHFFAVYIRGELLKRQLAVYLREGLTAATKRHILIGFISPTEEVETTDHVQAEMRALSVSRPWGDTLPPMADLSRLYTDVGTQHLAAVTAALTKYNGVRIVVSPPLAGISPGDMVSLDGTDYTVNSVDAGGGVLVVSAPLRKYTTANSSFVEEVAWGYIPTQVTSVRKGDWVTEWKSGKTWRVSGLDTGSTRLGVPVTRDTDVVPAATYRFLFQRPKAALLDVISIDIPATTAGEYTVTTNQPMTHRAGSIMKLLDGAQAGAVLELRHVLSPNREIADLQTTSPLVRGPTISAPQQVWVGVFDPLAEDYLRFSGTVTAVNTTHTLTLSAGADTGKGAYNDCWAWIKGQVPALIVASEGGTIQLDRELFVSPGDNIEIWERTAAVRYLDTSPSSLGSAYQGGARKATDSALLALVSIDTNGLLTATNPTAMRPNGKDFVTANTSPTDDPFAVGIVEVGDLVCLSPTGMFEVVQVISGNQLQVAPAPTAQVTNKPFTILPKTARKFAETFWSPVKEWL